MADELELELEGENTEEIISRKDKRLKKLSEDVKVKDEALTKEAEAKKKAEEERDNASKELEFLKGLNKISTKYQGATEYQDKIYEKVKQGYDVEDAAMTVLMKEGKWNPPAPSVEKETATGGSAATSLKGSGEKSLEDMSREEKREALKESFEKGEFRL